MDTTITIESITQVVKEDQEQSIIEAVKRWISEQPCYRSSFFIDEETLREVLYLGLREYQRIHGKSPALGEKF